ncbi:MAG: DUF1559 domain-containing protein [Gemmataceae bacterium]|nr:DUF1559 domain-containing protein [Gemmataceae bacterium]
MTAANQRVRGMSLVEVLVVIAILAVLIGLILPAVQRVRQSAARTDTANRMRQLILAVHHSVDPAGGKLPTINGMPPNKHASLFEYLLPYIEQLPPGDEEIQVRFFRSRTDPSYTSMTPSQPEYGGNISFSANATVFTHGRRLETIHDGTASTIALAERYARCNPRANVQWSLINSLCMTGDGKPIPCTNYDARRATFADGVYDDIVPITQNGQAAGSLKDTTFQITPSPSNCDPRTTQATTPSGLMAALADGSVRTISGAISVPTYWGLVTPEGGETLADW